MPLSNAYFFNIIKPMVTTIPTSTTKQAGPNQLPILEVATAPRERPSRTSTRQCTHPTNIRIKCHRTRIKTCYLSSLSKLVNRVPCHKDLSTSRRSSSTRDRNQKPCTSTYRMWLSVRSLAPKAHSSRILSSCPVPLLRSRH